MSFFTPNSDFIIDVYVFGRPDLSKKLLWPGRFRRVLEDYGFRRGIPTQGVITLDVPTFLENKRNRAALQPFYHCYDRISKRYVRVVCFHKDIMLSASRGI